MLSWSGPKLSPAISVQPRRNTTPFKEFGTKATMTDWPQPTLYTHSEIAGKKQRESRNFFWQSLRHCCVAHKTKAWAEKESLQKLNMNNLVGLPFKACTFLGTTVNLLYLWNIRIAKKKNVMPFSRVSTCEKLGFVFSLKTFLLIVKHLKVR